MTSAAAVRATAKRIIRRLLAADSRLAHGYMQSHSSRRLQIGGGGRKLADWLNTDLNPSRGVMRLDATARFPFADNVFAFVFSEQMIEHVDYESGCRMLRECHRVLQPGGTLRVTTPDLRFLTALFNAPWNDVQSRYVEWAFGQWLPHAPIRAAAFVLNNDVRNWGHAFIYDEEVLAHSLRAAGFADVRRCALGESEHPELCGLEQSETLPFDLLAHESLAMEAVKK